MNCVEVASAGRLKEEVSNPKDLEDETSIKTSLNIFYQIRKVL